MFLNSRLLELIEIDFDVITKFSLVIKLLDSLSCILLLQIVDLSGALALSAIREIDLLQLDILSGSEFQSDLLESLLG